MNQRRTTRVVAGGWALALAAGLVAGCDDELFASKASGGEVTGEGCGAVAEVISSNCLGCHSAGGQAGGLDLETDWYNTVIDRGVVVAGDAAGSLLYQRITSTSSSMPPTGLMPEANQAIVGDWIDAGAACEPDSGGSDGGGIDPNATGEELFAACAGCHGADGVSGSAPDLPDEVPGESVADIKEVVMEGKDSMPAIYTDEAAATKVAQYVVDTFGN